MDTKKHFFVLVLFFLFAGNQIIYGQKSHPFIVTGFWEYMNTTWAPAKTARWTNLSGIYNRINIRWNVAKNVDLHAGIRNNFSFGPLMADLYPSYTDELLKDYGWADMTFSLLNDTSYLLYTNIDRLFIKWNFKKAEITLGRQRINWGQNLVWNPNDIFNTFNYFDFDYIEHPGSDAFRLQYYTGTLSSFQLAIKLNHDKQITAAAMYKFNLYNYDIQVLSGVMEKDWVFGIGWAGQIKGAGFTGEISYFRNTDRFTDTTGQWIASVGINNTFQNRIYVHGSFIFNSTGTTGPAGMGTFFFNGYRTPKTLTRSKFDLFGEISYPITPLMKADISSIYNPNDQSVFVGPSFDFSLTENLELYTMGQLFFGKSQTEFGDYGQMLYLRLKWSF